MDAITYYSSDNVMEHRQQIAVNKNYICYALKQGHMRIICKNSSARTLAKGHLSGPVNDARYDLSCGKPLSLATLYCLGWACACPDVSCVDQHDGICYLLFS